MANGNGTNGRVTINTLYTFLRFLTPLLLMALIYYVASENGKVEHRVESRVAAKYLKADDFDRWLKWQYGPDSKRIQESLVRIETALERHSEGDDD